MCGLAFLVPTIGRRHVSDSSRLQGFGQGVPNSNFLAFYNWRLGTEASSLSHCGKTGLSATTALPLAETVKENGTNFH